MSDRDRERKDEKKYDREKTSEGKCEIKAIQHTLMQIGCLIVLQLAIEDDGV